MNENLKFSVSMCVYGGDNADWFQTAVDSVLNQSLTPDEIVLVVDGPVPDNLRQVIDGLDNNPLFKVIRFPENRGHGEARKAGLENCTNELVAIMDADDICSPSRFEKQIKAFEENPTADIIGGQITEFIDTPENIVGKRVVPLDDSAIKQYMKKRCPMNLVSVMFKKSSIEQVGGFIDWYCEEDYYLWVRMALAGHAFCNIDAPLVNVRVGEDMYERRGGVKYFKSERKLQQYMLKSHLIGPARYMVNVAERLIVQVLLPNKIRGMVFRKFARSKKE